MTCAVSPGLDRCLGAFDDRFQGQLLTGRDCTDHRDSGDVQPGNLSTTATCLILRSLLSALGMNIKII